VDVPGQKIVVIGDEDAVFGLGLIGLKGHAVTSIEQAGEAIRKAMSDPSTALILLTENWSEARSESRVASMDESSVLIVEIPSPGPAKPSMALEARIEQALGVHLEH
jgi:vacuolar-type H+-ATPase subunit F/Vma7